MKIEVGKEYRSRCGAVACITNCVPGNVKVFFGYVDGMPYKWLEDGRVDYVLTPKEHDFDLVAIWKADAMEIKAGGQYLSRDGRVARVTTPHAKWLRVFEGLIGGEPHEWYSSGHDFKGDDGADIVEHWSGEVRAGDLVSVTVPVMDTRQGGFKVPSGWYSAELIQRVQPRRPKMGDVVTWNDAAGDWTIMAVVGDDYMVRKGDQLQAFERLHCFHKFRVVMFAPEASQ